ncbi:MAG: hypothetical protein C7K11_03920 [Candidatus Amulumruptor caecigallinarius]|nr:MAG: hypothetical protein C7K11_03920 [Candidatus Amulumruptor caecigallinarius]
MRNNAKKETALQTILAVPSHYKVSGRYAGLECPAETESGSSLESEVESCRLVRTLAFNFLVLVDCLGLAPAVALEIETETEFCTYIETFVN